MKEILVPLEQAPRVHPVCDAGKLVTQEASDDHAAARLERLKVVSDLGTEEIWHVEGGLVHHGGDALGLHTLHDPLYGACAVVVGAALHDETVDADHRRDVAGVHLQHHAVD